MRLDGKRLTLLDLLRFCEARGLAPKEVQIGLSIDSVGLRTPGRVVRRPTGILFHARRDALVIVLDGPTAETFEQDRNELVRPDEEFSG